MAGKWVKSKYPGVRYREHETRRHKSRPDRYWTVYYKIDGVLHEEALGWSSKEGWNADKANEELVKLKAGHRTGEGPRTLREKRDREEERRRRAAKDATTFRQFYADHYSGHALETMKPESFRRVADIYRIHLEPIIGDFRLKDMGPVQVQKVIQEMTKKKLASRTIQYGYQVTRQIFNYARVLGMFQGDSPTKGVKLKRFDNQRKRFFTPAERASLMTELAVSSPETYRQAMLSLHTGMRWGEIAHLRWGDVDEVRGIINVLDGKGGSRPVVMTDQVKDMFASMKTGGPTALVFPGQNGQVQEQVSATFARIVKKLNLNKGVKDRRMRVTFHTLRHTFASLMRDAGVDLPIVMDALGHKSMALTLRYAHIGPGQMKNAIQRLSGTLPEPSTIDQERLRALNVALDNAGVETNDQGRAHHVSMVLGWQFPARSLDELTPAQIKRAIGILEGRIKPRKDDQVVARVQQ